jgi:hypothetical protein
MTNTAVRFYFGVALVSAVVLMAGPPAYLACLPGQERS